MDKDNFEYQLEQFHVVMENGLLYVNSVGYEEADDMPDYTFAREIAKAKGLIEL